MENKSFEEYLQLLEQIVKTLENKDTTLEQAVDGYTKGLEISKKCYDILNSKEQLIVQKMTENGLVDFQKEEE